ncbi:MAG: hypothetical protein ACI9EK_002249, partial [Psychroserpens sp.]
MKPSRLQYLTTLVFESNNDVLLATDYSNELKAGKVITLGIPADHKANFFNLDFHIHMELYSDLSVSKNESNNQYSCTLLPVDLESSKKLCLIAFPSNTAKVVLSFVNDKVILDGMNLIWVKLKFLHRNTNEELP